MLMFVPVTKSI